MSEINLKKNIALSTVSKVLTIVASFVSNWFLSRFLGPELRGKYVYLFTLNQIIWMFLDLGVHKSFPYLLQNQRAKLSSLYKLSAYTYVFSLLVVGLLYLFAGDYFYELLGGDYPRYIVLALGIYIVSFQFYTRSQYLQLGMDMVKNYALQAFLPTFSFMLLIIPLYWLMPAGSKVEWAFLLNAVIFIFFMVVMQYSLRKAVKYKENLSWRVVKDAYKLGTRAFASGYLIQLMMRLDLVIIKALGSYAQVGVYTLAVNFVDMINMSCNTIGAVLLVKLMSLKDEIVALGVMRRIFLMISILNLIAILGFVLVGKWFIVKLYGSGYEDAYLSFILLIPSIYGITLGALFNTFIWSKGFPVISIIAPIVPLGIKVGLNYLLVPSYGIFGSSIASSISYMLWLLILLGWYFYRNRDIKPSILLPRREDFVELYEYGQTGIRWLKGKLRLQKLI